MPESPRAGNDPTLDVHGDQVPHDAYYEAYDDDEQLDLVDVDDLTRADYHVRMARFWARVEEAEQAAVDDVLEDIRTRWSARKGELGRNRRHHERTLEAWHRRGVGARVLARSVSLPSGRVGLKKPPRPAFVVDDEDAFRAHIAGMTDADGGSVEEAAWVMTEKFSITALEKAIGCRPKGADRNGEVGTRYEIRDPDTGQVVPGAHYTELPDQWSVTD